LKRTGLMPIFSAARVVALRSSSAARASPVRLAQAANIDPSVVSNLTVAHGILLRAVLNQQLRDIDRGIRLGNSIAPAELSSHELDELKWALDQVPAIRDVLGLPTFG